MKRMKSYIIISAMMIVTSSVLYSQENPADKVMLTFSEPGRPGLVRISLISGSITVKGHNQSDVIVEARARSRKYSHHKETAGGMRRIAIATTGLEVTEEDNVLRVSASTHKRTVDLTLTVPTRTSLKITTINNGHIRVEGITGDLELNNTNGSIKAFDISGSVVANTTNGEVKVTFNKVEPEQPMSFVSFNGNVDVTLPVTIQIDVKMKSDQGEIFSDFDIAIEQNPKVVQEDTRKEGGRYRVRVESAIRGVVNGGGPLYHFSTYNGNIYIRKK